MQNKTLRFSGLFVTLLNSIALILEPGNVRESGGTLHFPSALFRPERSVMDGDEVGMDRHLPQLYKIVFSPKSRL